MSSHALPVGSGRDAGLANPTNGSRSNSPTTLRGDSEVGRGVGRTAAKRSYVTRARLREIEGRLSQRDHHILKDVARLQLTSGGQLRRLHYEDSASGHRLVRHDLVRLVAWQLLARLDRRIGGVRSGSEGFVYGLAVAGQRLLHPDRRRYRAPWTPEPSYLAHAIQVSELAVQLTERTRTSGFELELFDAEPAAWRSFNGAGGQRLVLKPDAYVECLTGQYEDRYFVEVDRGTESLTRIAEKGRAYGRHWQSGHEQDAHGIYPQVLWIAPDEKRRDQIIEALSRLQPEHWRLFRATTDQQAAAAIAGGIVETEIGP
jgi:Replication-relaxation